MTMDNNFLHVQLLGMVNALKTGDPTVDILLVMVLPYLISQFSQDLLKFLKSLMRSKKKTCKPSFSRTISYHTSRSAMSGATVCIDKDSYNLILIKAIQLFVHNHRKLDVLNEADIDLISMLATSTSSSSTMRGAITSQQPSTVSLCQSFQLVERPVQRQWHTVGDFEGSSVEMQFADSLGGKDDAMKEGGISGGAGSCSPLRSIEIKLKSHGSLSIQNFVNTAYEWYVKQLESLEISDRFLFDLQHFGRGYDASVPPSYKRYKLGDEKTFASLFSQQSKSLLKIVDQFQNKTGKYRVHGYPHKLGLLLTGPPGSGKTSLIKALAHYTNRHIVNVPLSRIATNNNLMDLLFNKKYQLDDNGEFSNLEFNQVIYVLEDVDASSEVVKDRRLLQKERKAQAAKTVGSAPSTTPSSQRSSKCSSAEDYLNLCGLLNALDGVVETPGRIVIMTSNHPEMLDPALIRPGRIDKKLYLSYMLSIDIIDMIEHYYETKISDKDKDKDRIENMINNGLEVTAAKVEQLAIEEDSVDDLISSLESRGGTDSGCSTTDLSNGSWSDTSRQASEPVAVLDEGKRAPEPSIVWDNI